jgi:hypothetical protein
MVGIGGRLAGMSDPGAYESAHEGLVLGGRYRLVAPVGAGGMAVVWEAHDSVLGRAVAVKLLAPAQAGDARSRERIRREARAAAALAHPNIAQVHDYGEMGRPGRVFPYVVMELVPGGTLSARLSAGALAPGFAMRTGAEIAAALAAAHAEGLVHRDIKPGNVMLAPTGAKVVDFGIAAAVAPDGSGAPDDPDEVLGTPAYLAPERLVGDAVVPASDVYALGIVLYRMLSGRSPWSSEDTRQMVRAHLYVPPAPLPYVAGVPEYVVRLCDRCLAKNPAHRPSAEEAAATLAHGAGIRVVVDEPQPSQGVELPLSRADEMPLSPGVGPLSQGGEVRSSGGAEAQPSGGVLPEPTVVVRRGPAPRPVTASPAAASETADSPRRAGWVAAVVALLAGAGAAVWFFAQQPVKEAAGAPGRTVTAASAAQPGGDPGRTAAPGPVATTSDPKPDRRTSSARPTSPGAAAPAAPVPATTTATEPPSPSPTVELVERTLTSEGGTVVATCSAPTTARLLSWTATRPYKVESADEAASEVTFRHGTDLVTMTVTCDGGIPAAEVARA